ncbi:MAG: alginate O-acetyltransferase complex protein AlgI [Vicingaceae bacterium]|jgi:alginate O-acetyltransferase complex protein AlgI
MLWVSIVFNLSFLLYYKYFNFFIENLNIVLEGGHTYDIAAIILPIGISFFTFQKISYSVDIYRKTAPPLKSLLDYSLYIMLFPQLIAGPIVRYNEIADQLNNREFRNYNDRIYGLYRFAIGLAKKVIIANVLGEKADLIFGLESVDLNSSVAWLGIICYTFQIYFDFSGYSDMAIGLGRMMGFKFPENFNSPYISQSITEFWKRWHITLGSWMRDYLYIPLGGNRVSSKVRLYSNLWLVFLISGLWHGASWNFVLWGAYHGLFLIFDRLFLNTLTKGIGKLGRVMITFLVVLFGWVLFRTENLTAAVDYYSALLSFDFQDIYLFVSAKFYRVLSVALIMSFLLFSDRIKNMYSRFVDSGAFQNQILKSVFALFLITICVANLAGSGFNPFIYFRF